VINVILNLIIVEKMLNDRFITYYCRYCGTTQSIPFKEYGLTTALKPIYCPICLGMHDKHRRMDEIKK